MVPRDFAHDRLEVDRVAALDPVELLGVLEDEQRRDVAGVVGRGDGRVAIEIDASEADQRRVGK